MAPAKKDLGSTPDARTRDSTLTSDTTDDSAKSIAAWLRGGVGMITRTNIGWAISFALSVIYLFLFITTHVKCSYSQSGFCVTNYDGVECPPLNNSHFYAFVVDALFTAAALLVPKIVGKSPGGKKNLIGVLIAILSHGLLHLYLSLSGCKLDSGEDKTVGGILFGVFTWFISYFILASTSSSDNVFVNTIVSVAVAALTVWLSVRPPGDQGIASIFMTTQLMASGAGFLIPKEGLDSSRVGKLFVAPCAVSIIELIACCKDGKQGLFNKLGGHVWYDITLHTAILSTLFPAKNSNRKA